MKLTLFQTHLSFKSRRFLWYLMAIMMVAFVLRLAVSYQLKNTYSPVASPSSQTDNFTYITKGMETADGRYAYSDGFYYQPFYYAVYLPIVFKILGDGNPDQSVAERYKEAGVRSVILSQSLVGALTVFICGLLAASLFGRRCGIIAAFMMTLARMPVFYTAFTLIATLQAFLLTLMLLLAVSAARKKSLTLYGICGLVAGLGNLTRGNILLLLPLVGLLAAWTFRREWKKGLASVALLVAMFILPQLPFSIVNLRVHKRWVGPSSAGPAVLALGNTPEAPPGGREPFAGAGPMAYPPSYGLWMRQHEASGEEHVSIYSNMFHWFKNEPFAWFELKFRMFLLFWNRVEVPNNVSLNQAQSSLLHLPIFLDFWLIGSLGITGLLMAFWKYRKKSAILLTALTVIGYSLSIVLFYVLARFRVPMIPLLCIFAALALDVFWRNRRTFFKKRLLPHLLLLSGGFMLTCGGFQIYRFGWEQQVMRFVRPDGVNVSFPEKHTVKDHGPLEFGGWQPATVQQVSVQKSFSVQPVDSRSNLSKVVLTIFVVSEYDQMLGVEVRNHVMKKPLKKGPQWIDLELPGASVINKGDHKQLTVDFALKSLTGAPFFIYIDKQREYRRTQLNNKPVGGELVAEAELYFDSKPEK